MDTLIDAGCTMDGWMDGCISTLINTHIYEYFTWISFCISASLAFCGSRFTTGLLRIFRAWNVFSCCWWWIGLSPWWDPNHSTSTCLTTGDKIILPLTSLPLKAFIRLNAFPKLRADLVLWLESVETLGRCVRPFTSLVTLFAPPSPHFSSGAPPFRSIKVLYPIWMAKHAICQAFLDPFALTPPVNPPPTTSPNSERTRKVRLARAQTRDHDGARVAPPLPSPHGFLPPNPIPQGLASSELTLVAYLSEFRFSAKSASHGLRHVIMTVRASFLLSPPPTGSYLPTPSPKGLLAVRLPLWRTWASLGFPRSPPRTGSDTWSWRCARRLSSPLPPRVLTSQPHPPRAC